MKPAAQPVKQSAPGPYLGFTLQSVRLCYHLLTCPKGAKVSLEYIDDVAIHNANGTVELEQTKSALKQNPLADWSPGLWKTLSDWLENAAKGSFDLASSRFRLYVTPEHTGTWAQKIHAAKSPEQVASLTTEIATAFGGMRKKPKGVSEYLDRFLNATAADRAALVIATSVVSEADPLEPIKHEIRTTVRENLLDPFSQHAIGMAQGRINALLRADAPPIIDGDAFKADFIAFVQKNNLPGLLTSLTSAPSEQVIATTFSAQPTFVRQLRIIQAPDNEQLRAVSDYLRSSADKAVWAEAGLVFSNSLDEWDDGLVAKHGRICGEVADFHGDKDALVRGRAIYRKCADVQQPLDGREVPSYFVHGCFNALADALRVGWHPDFATMLKE